VWPGNSPVNKENGRWPSFERVIQPRFIPYVPDRVPADEVSSRSSEFFEKMNRRRSVRAFSPDPVPREVLETIIRTASTAPSGAHRQPWTFVLVGDATLKSEIREAAEAEERLNYEGGRLPPDWREALEPLGTDWEKPYLEIAPWIVILFEQRYGIRPDESTFKNFYVKESVGIAAGLFIAAVHSAGLATLPHTPSPMAFLSRVLERPDNERAFAVFPVGYPAADAVVPDLVRKPLSDVLVVYD
jgi:iodotyrosine deiodinase